MKSRRPRSRSTLLLLAAVLLIAQPLAALEGPAHTHGDACCCLEEALQPEPSCCSDDEAEPVPRTPEVASACDCRAMPAPPSPRKPTAPAHRAGTGSEAGERLARGAWVSDHTPILVHLAPTAAEVVARTGPTSLAADPILGDRVRPTPRRLLARGVSGHLAELSIARL